MPKGCFPRVKSQSSLQTLWVHNGDENRGEMNPGAVGSNPAVDTIKTNQYIDFIIYFILKLVLVHYKTHLMDLLNYDNSLANNSACCKTVSVANKDKSGG